jgi:hypothetical protein
VRRVGRFLGQTQTGRLARWRTIRLVSLLAGLFVAFNGVTGLLGRHVHALTIVSSAIVVTLGAAIVVVGARLAGPRPR